MEGTRERFSPLVLHFQDVCYLFTSMLFCKVILAKPYVTIPRYWFQGIHVMFLMIRLRTGVRHCSMLFEAGAGGRSFAAQRGLYCSSCGNIIPSLSLPQSGRDALCSICPALLLLYLQRMGFHPAVVAHAAAITPLLVRSGI